MPLTGGYSEDKIPDEEIQALFSSSVDSLSTLLQKTVENLILVSYQSQVVAGVNYRVKATVTVAGETKRVVFTAFKPLPHTQQPLQVKEASFEE
jgi:hypothetical protein